MIWTKRSSAALLGLLLVVACHNDELNRPFADTPVDPLFARYVSMGNSITAGVQSAGINDSTQQQSYAVVLARAMRSPFFPPLLRRPGCPPPYTNVFTRTRLTPPGFPASTDSSCYLRVIPPIPPPYISNTAVPSAEVLDIYRNVDTAANANALTQFFLGGLTQAQMMAKAQPTFVSVWIGNNDVLGAATSSTNPGDSTKITPVAVFQSRYDSMTSLVAAAKPKGAVLIGVGNVTDVPFFSAGAIYWAIKNKLALPDTFPTLFTVSANCAPGALAPGVGRGDTTLVPFPYGAALLVAASPPNNQPRNLDCSDSARAAPARRRVPGLQRPHRGPGDRASMGVPRSESDPRLAAHCRDGRAAVPAPRTALQRQSVRDGVLLRRRAPERSLAKAHRAEAARSHQRRVFDRDSRDPLSANPRCVTG